MHEIDIWSVPWGHQDDDEKEICTDWYKTNCSSVREETMTWTEEKKKDETLT